MQKDDGSHKYMIKETVNQMKNDLLNSLEYRIEKLEAKLFDKEVEQTTETVIKILNEYITELNLKKRTN